MTRQFLLTVDPWTSHSYQIGDDGRAHRRKGDVSETRYFKLDGKEFVYFVRKGDYADIWVVPGYVAHGPYRTEFGRIAVDVEPVKGTSLEKTVRMCFRGRNLFLWD